MRRIFLHQWSTLLVLAMFIVLSPMAYAVELKQRVLYNFDGDGCMYTKANGEVPCAIDVDDVKRLIEEIAYDGSQITTMLVAINGQVMYYPTQAGTLRGTQCTPEQIANWPATETQRFENMNNFFNAGIDPYAVMLAETKKKGLEAMLSFRVNDAHGNDFLRTKFWNDHPAYRLGDGLDFWHSEVRDYVFNLTQEAVQRYDCDGIELDFNRFPTYFNTGTTEERITRINSLVSRVRSMLDVEGAKRGKHLTLTARIPSNFGSTPPTYETSRAIGCDPVAWVDNGWVDYLTVSEFLFERGDLPIASWKQLITEVPIYGGIECTAGSAEEQFLTPDEYRLAAQRNWAKGADGIYLFNFFVPRADFGREPAFEVLTDLGANSAGPTTLGWFDGPMDFDGASLAKLPEGAVGNEGTVEFEFKADAISGCLWYIADVFGGSVTGGEHRIFLGDSKIYARLWSKGEYAVIWEAPLTDTTQWHSIKMSWKEGEDTLITFDGVTSKVANARALDDFTPSEGQHVLGGYPSGGAGTVHFDGAIRNFKVHTTYSQPAVIPGDANNDGRVDGSDVTILAGNWQAGVENPNPLAITWAMGDFNGDGRVDGSDVTILAGNWQAGVTIAATAIPEPSTVTLMLLTACLAALKL